MVARLVVALKDRKSNVRKGACRALKNFGERVATTEVINGLVIALGDSDDDVRCSACDALTGLGKKSAKNKVIGRLVVELVDRNWAIRRSFREVLLNLLTYLVRPRGSEECPLLKAGEWISRGNPNDDILDVCLRLLEASLDSEDMFLVDCFMITAIWSELAVVIVGENLILCGRHQWIEIKLPSNQFKEKILTWSENLPVDIEHCISRVKYGSVLRQRQRNSLFSLVKVSYLCCLLLWTSIILLVVCFSLYKVSHMFSPYMYSLITVILDILFFI